MFPLFLKFLFLIDFGASWEGLGPHLGGFEPHFSMVWGGLGLIFGGSNEAVGSKWTWDVQNAFGNICFKFCVNVLQGLWVKVTWPYRIGPADRAQRLK